MDFGYFCSVEEVVATLVFFPTEVELWLVFRVLCGSSVLVLFWYQFVCDFSVLAF